MTLRGVSTGTLRTPEQTVAWARGQARIRSRGWDGWCLKFARLAIGIGTGSPTAIDAWETAKVKHYHQTPPRGVPVFWSGGSHGYGHVAISSGDWDCYSTDVVVQGQVRWCVMPLIRWRWGLRYLGWSEDLNGVSLRL